MKYTHVGLFNGIGGFQFAAEWMGWENIMSCEIDSFCNQVTPTTIERVEHSEKMRSRSKKKEYKNRTKYNSLMSQIVYGNFLPSPVASDATTGAIIGKNDNFVITKTGMPRKINQQGTDGSVGLARLGKLGMLPTPNASEGEKYCITYNPKSQRGKELTPLMKLMTGQNSLLRPQFVMEMMGFPQDWTLLPFLSGDEKV